MKKCTIYHNPNCSKSRDTLVLLEKNEIRPIVKDYLQDGFTESELKNVLSLIELSEIVRTTQKEFTNNPFDITKVDEVIKGLISSPILFQRPVVIYDDKALICRPPERVLTLIQV